MSYAAICCVLIHLGYKILYKIHYVKGILNQANKDFIYCQLIFIE